MDDSESEPSTSNPMETPMDTTLFELKNAVETGPQIITPNMVEAAMNASMNEAIIEDVIFQPSTRDPSVAPCGANEQDEEEAAQICAETIIKLLSDPHKMCSLLSIQNLTKPPEAADAGPKLPELIISLQHLFTNQTILARAARHLQHLSEDTLYYLTTMIPVNRDIAEVIRMVIEETHCTTPDGLSKLIQYLCDLLAETVPKRYRIEKMINMSEAELQQAEKALPPFEGDFNNDDWLALCTSYVRGGAYQIFDSSNITIAEVLKEFATEYKGFIHEELWNCSKNGPQYRASDSHFQKAFQIADGVDYEKIYTLLSKMAGCRHVNTKDIDK